MIEFKLVSFDGETRELHFIGYTKHNRIDGYINVDKNPTVKAYRYHTPQSILDMDHIKFTVLQP